MKRILTVLIQSLMIGGLFWTGGCNPIATSATGVFVPNVMGPYVLENVTADCADQFDMDINIFQSEENIILEPQSADFTNLTGTIDENGGIALAGASNFGSPFDCTAQFASGLVSGVCLAEVQTCEIDPVSEIETCTTDSESCGFTYVRQ